MSNCTHPAQLSTAVTNDARSWRGGSARTCESRTTLRQYHVSAIQLRSSWLGSPTRGSSLLPRRSMHRRCNWNLVNARAEGPTRNIEPGSRFLQDIGLEDSNDDVKLLQTVLANEGHLGVEPTGYFGRVTLDAVKSWQEANGLPPSGFVGPQSRLKLNASLKKAEDARRVAAASEARGQSTGLSERAGGEVDDARAHELHAGRATQLAHAMASASPSTGAGAPNSKAQPSSSRSGSSPSSPSATKGTQAAGQAATVLPAGAKLGGAATTGSVGVVPPTSGPPWLPQKVLPVHALAGILLTLVGVYMSHRVNLMTRKRQFRSQRGQQPPPSPRLSRMQQLQQQDPEQREPTSPFDFFTNVFKRPTAAGATNGGASPEGKRPQGVAGRSRGQWHTVEPAAVPPAIASQRDRMLSRQGRSAAASKSPPALSSTASNNNNTVAQPRQRQDAEKGGKGTHTDRPSSQSSNAARAGRPVEGDELSGPTWQTVGTPMEAGSPGMSSLLASAAAREGEGAMLRRAGSGGSFVGFSFGDGAGKGGEATASGAGQGRHADYPAWGGGLEEGGGEFDGLAPQADKGDRGGKRSIKPPSTPPLGVDKAGWARREPRGVSERNKQ